MSLQELIASFYVGSKKIDSVTRLTCFKNSEVLYIHGNGPSAFSFCKHIEGNYDNSGTSAISLSKFPITYYFAEPHFAVNHEGYSISSSLEISAHTLHALLHYEWTSAVSQNCSVVIPNPQIPPNSLGYRQVVRHSTIMIPPWFMINEADDLSIKEGLREYFQNGDRGRYILNFRGSVIRQISLAFALGYKTIYLSGIDPSSCHYWYTDSATRYGFMSPQHSYRIAEIMELYSNIHSQCVSSGARGYFAEIPDTYFTFTKSILIALRLFCNADKGANVVLWVDDPWVLDYIIEIGLNRTTNFHICQ